MSELPEPAAADRANRSMLLRFSLMVLIMFAFGYLMVPFYERLCKATGFRDIDTPDTVTNTQTDATRTVRIELDANVNRLPWKFRPETPIVSVHPGEFRNLFYEVENNSDRPITGQAIPSYRPRLAGEYFKKIECFCFTRQALGPHEKRRMPVVFVVDPKLPTEVNTITLSYTFFEVDGIKS
jgi:cytochrome c oxidase assembly protein subunit 11